MKVQKSIAETEDIILRKIFRVTLATEDRQGVYAEVTAGELLREGKALLLSADMIERVIVDRLSVATESPFHYLSDCYRRATEESKKIQNMEDANRRLAMEIAICKAKKLSVCYSRLYLANPHGFVKTSDESPVLALIFGLLNNYGYGVQSPPRFLSELFEEDSELIFNKVYEDLRSMVMSLSILGDFQQPLALLYYLVTLPLGAKSMVSHESWIPRGDHRNGRSMESTSLLGPFFHISALPDNLFKTEPDVGQFLSQVSDLSSRFSTIGNFMTFLYAQLHNVLRSLLDKPDTRESVLVFLGEVINRNASRWNMKVDHASCASSGMFVNLSAVMLRLCEPFLDLHLTKRDKIDPGYAFSGHRLKLSDLTALHASSQEVSELINKYHTTKANDAGFRDEGRLSSSPSSNASGQNAKSKTKYSFICECFFMTARVLHLGLIKALYDYKHLGQIISRHKDTLQKLKATRDRSPSPELELKIARMEKELELYSQEKLCHEAQILRDEDFFQRALSFYRLVIIWLVDLVGGFKMPLPSTCPMEFSCMPEHFVEDAMDLLLFASRVPKALNRQILDEFMEFLIMFMASPEYVKNPYLRAKMVEVLNCWMPRSSGSSYVRDLFEGHQFSLNYLVRNLLELSVDVEFTGSESQFYDKFSIRHNINELLHYLWEVPGHRNAWKQVAKEEEKGVYFKFLNYLVNDSIYLLDESLEKIAEMKQIEAEMLNTAEWEQRPAQHREERMRSFQSLEDVRVLMKLANENVGMFAFTSEEITTPFLRPEMVMRIAHMLNYFLQKLVGSQRNSLSFKGREKYEFRPKQLLQQIVRIYVNLARGDSENIFPGAIASDGRSYDKELFENGENVLRKLYTDKRMIEEFGELGKKVAVAASEAMDAEASLGDIPEDFLDPIEWTLMKDPVILPSSKTTVDRATILRHLLNDSHDPFNRANLTSDMLVPNIDLKARIDEFVRSHQSKKRARGEESSK